MSSRRLHLRKRRQQLIIGSALVVAIVAVVGIALWSDGRGSEPSNVPAVSVEDVNPVDETVYPPAVYFVGDSFVQGTPQDNFTTWPQYIADAEGWQITKVASHGAGYVTAGASGGTYAELIEQNGVSNADELVFSGGYNDRETSIAEFRKAVASTFDLARSLSPDVPIVVLSEFVPRFQYSDGANQRNAVLRGEAERIGATYIPVSDLLRGDGLIGADGTHPTTKGQQLIAETVAPQLPQPAA